MHAQFFRWYVRNSVRIMCQGGDHSKNASLVFLRQGGYALTSERKSSSYHRLPLDRGRMIKVKPY